MDDHEKLLRAHLMSAVADLLRQSGSTLMAADWLVDRIRLYKSAAELDWIRRAAAIADSAMLQFQGDLHPGMTGLEASAI